MKTFVSQVWTFPWECWSSPSDLSVCTQRKHLYNTDAWENTLEHRHCFSGSQKHKKLTGVCLQLKVLKNRRAGWGDVVSMFVWGVDLLVGCAFHAEGLIFFQTEVGTNKSLCTWSKIKRWFWCLHWQWMKLLLSQLDLGQLDQIHFPRVIFEWLQRESGGNFHPLGA